MRSAEAVVSRRSCISLISGHTDQTWSAATRRQDGTGS
jgi:hypothetical protein